MRRDNGRSRSPAGFTLVETLITVVMISLLAAFLTPPIATSIQHARVNRATRAVAGDLELAFSMAARQRKPIRLTTTSATTYTIADRTSGTVRTTRDLGTASEFKLDSLSFVPATIDVFPSGVATAALTVSISANGYTRQITMSRGGQIRVMPL